MTFTRTCQERPIESGTFYVEPPLAFVQLNETCSATNNQLTLQSFYKLKSQVRQEIDPIVINNVSGGINFSNIKLWEPINKIIPRINFSHHYNKLPEIGKMKMENLVKEINSLEEVSLQKDSFWKTYKFLIIGMIIIFIVFIVLIIKWKLSKKMIGFVSSGGNRRDCIRDSSTVEMRHSSRSHKSKATNPLKRKRGGKTYVASDPIDDDVSIHSINEPKIRRTNISTALSDPFRNILP